MNLLCSIEDDQLGTKLRGLLDHGWYVFRSATPGRRLLSPGDRLCFYQRRVGVVAQATAASAATLRHVPGNPDPQRYPYAFEVRGVRYFFKKPVVLDSDLRAQLDAYKGRDPLQPWAWFVQGTHIISDHDFKVLTGRA